MNANMRLLYQMLLQPLDQIKPNEIIAKIRDIKNSFNGNTHTYVNANLLEDQVQTLWEKGCLNSELLVLLCTNLIYDTKAVIALRRHVAAFARKNNPDTYK